MAHDFGTELWTLKRDRMLVERTQGVRFSEVHVWRLLGAMGFSSQTPERRAVRRTFLARPNIYSTECCRALLEQRPRVNLALRGRWASLVSP